MKILRFVAQVWRERARSIAFSGTVSFFAWPLCALAVSIAQLHSHTLTVLLSSILAGVTGALASFARERHLANLEVQFRNVEELKPVNWDVVVNGVKTGEVSNADYAAIQYEVYASNWLWLQQAVSILKAVWRSATSTVSALPFALTWALVLGALCAPNEVLSVFSALGHATAEQITSAAQTLVAFWLVVGMVTFAAPSLIGGRSNWVSVFDSAIALKLRRRTGTSAVGNVTVVRFAEGDVVALQSRYEKAPNAAA
ncbi:hypothetical protein [Ralstonia insidiosa]|nr:hypothetical protein [Ralstonia insidiosa]MBA9940559.1 hypothetical protein [Ralstonia insidiosa]MBC9968989.1 hypothetical protein [Ralstonia insidiosa]MBX3905072.1 hypothetical protein [Ralstonia insidiosa]